MDWNYFKILSLAFGTFIIIMRLIVHLTPEEKWNHFELQVAYTEKKPPWLWIGGLLGIALAGYTWYMHFTAPVDYSLVITLIISLPLLKASQVLFNYNRFREVVTSILTENRAVLHKINVVMVIFGVALIFMGLYVY